MKVSVFALLFVIAGAFAFPQDAKNNVVEEQIKNVIERVKERIVERGLDPLEVEKAEFRHVATPSLIEVAAFVEEFSFKGLSNIVLHQLEYIPVINRLTFDISLPEISASAGKAGVEIIFFERNLDAQLDGSLVIQGLRLAGEINLNVSIIDGISVRTITLDFSLGGVESELSLSANERDFSEDLNNLLGVSIPNVLDLYKNEINRALETVAREIIDRIF